MGKKRARLYEVPDPDKETPPDPNSNAEKARQKHLRSIILARTAEYIAHAQENPHRNTAIASEKDKGRKRNATGKAIKEQLDD